VTSLTSSDVHEVLAGGLVDLDVAVTNVMLVTSEKWLKTIKEISQFITAVIMDVKSIVQLSVEK
jgi:hypothetical protein